MRKIRDLHIQELEEVRKQLVITDNLKCMIRAMLSCERLWQPFLYTSSHWGEETQSKVREYMDGAWERIFSDEVNGDKERYYGQLLDDIDERACKVEDNDREIDYYYKGYLVNTLFSGFGWFFMQGKDKMESMVLCTLDLISDKIVEDHGFADEQEVDYYLNNPYSKAEFERFEHDRVISELYPVNKDEIIKLRETYQNMWIIPKNGKI